jgi:hypothetical protein
MPAMYIAHLKGLHNLETRAEKRLSDLRGGWFEYGV